MKQILVISKIVGSRGLVERLKSEFKQMGIDSGNFMILPMLAYSSASKMCKSSNTIAVLYGKDMPSYDDGNIDMDFDGVPFFEEKEDLSRIVDEIKSLM